MKKNIQNIITVNYSSGRVGSSLVMGLLKHSGVSVGAVCSAVDDNNPNGYFEISDMIWLFYERLFPMIRGFMPYPINKNDKELKSHLTEENIKEFESFVFKKWFSGKNPFIASKAPFSHTHLIFDIIAKRNNINHIKIFLHRDLKERVRSIRKMNGGYGTGEQWYNWLQEWKYINKQYKFDIKIDFSDWFTDPYETYLKVYDLCKLPIKLSEAQVREWINPEYKHF